MNKIIITNDSDIEDIVALDMIKKIVSEGRISDSGKQYCRLAQFTNNLIVSSRLNKCSDSFYIWREK